MKTTTLISAVVVAVALVGGPALIAQSPAAPVKASEPSGQLSLLGFTLGKSTIDDVRTRLGDSKIKKCSREEEASNEICYVSSGPDRTKVVFRAGFSGGWKEVDGFKIISSRLNPQCYRECPAAIFVPDSLRTPGGLRLGLTRQELIRLLGKPSRVSGEKLTFQWQSRQRMTEDEIAQENKTFASPVKDPYWDVLDTINVILRDNAVAEVEVLHTLSY